MDFNFNEQDYQQLFGEEFEKKQKEFEKIKQSKLIFSLVGTVNCGKSSTINALMNRELSEANATPGWTKDMKLFKLNENVIIADTPGLQDINEDVSKRTEEFIEKDTDIILFFLNAAVGLTSHEKKAIESFKKLNRSLIIVLNKIDIWYDDGTFNDEAYQQTINYIKAETGIAPIAISSKKKIGIELLHLQIMKIVENSGKDLLYAKVSRYKEEIVKKWINTATTSAATVAAVPIPGSDIVPLTAIQVGLAMKIADIYDCKVNKADIMKLIASTIMGSFSKQAYKAAITAMKGLGWLGGPILEGAVMAVAATIAATTTYAFGWSCNFYYKNGMSIDLGDLGVFYQQTYDEYKK